jgi:hypothetical protein
VRQQPDLRRGLLLPRQPRCPTTAAAPTRTSPATSTATARPRW